MSLFNFNLTGTSSTSSLVRKCKKVESQLAAEFNKTYPLKDDYSKAEKELLDAKEQYDEFLDEHEELPLTRENASNMSRSQNLRLYKIGAIVFSTLVSGVAIQTLLSSWTSFNVNIWLSFLLGFFVETILLFFSIRIRGHKVSEQEQGILAMTQPYFFIVPLLYLPLIDLFIISLEVDSLRIYIMTISLIIAFFINIIVVSYHQQFALDQNISNARKHLKKLRKKLTSAQNKVNAIGKKMQKQVLSIKSYAFQFHSHWVRIPSTDKPVISLPAPYRYVLNNKVWHEQLLPIPAPEYVFGPHGSELESYSNFWEATTESPIQGAQSQLGASSDTARQSRQANARTDDNQPPSEGADNAQRTNNTAEPAAQSNDAANANASDQTDDQDGPEEDSSFGTSVSDNEKFV